MTSLVRVIVLNYDGGDVTLRCLDSLAKLAWPEDRLEIVMVDNASVDGLVWKVPRLFPKVRVIESLENEGFARGNNLAMRDLDGVDVVCLLNNDAWVEPDWLDGLVRALDSGPRVGAACSKMLFAREVVGVEIDPGDRPTCLTNVRVDGEDVLAKCGLDERFDKVGRGHASTTPQHWLSKPASVWFALPTGAKTPSVFAVELFSEVPHTVTLRSVDGSTTVEVGADRKCFDLQVGTRSRVINNAGGGLFTGWNGGDIGFKELDLGQRDEPFEPFSFCGGAVAFKAEFLREVGLFDPTFFLYYEDLDLAWRGRFHGWTYVYAPTSVVYHEHAYSSVEGSQFFNFWVDRNRRLTLIKNAPARIAWRAFTGAVIWGLRDSFFPIVKALVRFRRPPIRQAGYRLRQMLSLLKAVPAALRERRRLGRLGKIERSFAAGWMSER